MVDDTHPTQRPLDPRTNWSGLSQAERDAAYDNNAAVKNSAALIAERNEASGRLRGTLKSHLDLPYGERANNKIDLYPAGPRAPTSFRWRSIIRASMRDWRYQASTISRRSAIPGSTTR